MSASERGRALIEARRPAEWERILAGKAPRADAFDDTTRELLVAALALGAGDEERLGRCWQAARVAGNDDERLLDLVLLAASVVGPSRALRAAELLAPAGVGETAWSLAAKLSEIPEGGGREVMVGGRAIALLRQGDRVHAVTAHCPHRRGPLADGYLEPDTITCPLHAWSFDLATGDCRGVPGTRIEIFETRIEGDRVLVRV